MKILSHRGFWIKPEEKNTLISFERSFSNDFGTETDIRDFNGELVISHDIPSKGSLSVASLFEIYNSFNCDLPLALNIKADGLQTKLSQLIAQYNIINYFVFDMSIPDGLRYFDFDMKVFTRQSEYEKEPAYYEESNGVWMDEFSTSWITPEDILFHNSNGKDICIVSPELHGREFISEWCSFKEISKSIKSNSIMICTDYPDKAKDYFYE